MIITLDYQLSVPNAQGMSAGLSLGSFTVYTESDEAPTVKDVFVALKSQHIDALSGDTTHDAGWINNRLSLLATLRSLLKRYAQERRGKNPKLPEFGGPIQVLEDASADDLRHFSLVHTLFVHYL